MRNGWSAHSGLAATNGDLLPLNILMHCRTVVESQNFVTTGLMTHVEGELFEVELSEFEAFELGEKVKLTIYTPAGIQTFPSTVFAKYEGAIALIQPPEVQKRFEEKREYPRVEVKGSVQLVDVPGPEGKPLEAVLRNISISGIGFAAPDLPALIRDAKLKATVELGFGFNCELEIVRRELQEDGIMCGAKMNVLEPDMMRPLRAFILRQQVERNVRNRRENETKKRASFRKP
ncbi:PilZ domain-containing protein [Cohnella sp. CFH 77786]|uniref:PilZ domain-containing protein n=1 Tax=Cohnella sp. CFH 77786 TaxID=2662265 RepID=UPI001C6093F7|nr:PilZ domain-containing protein [Cohnella sp. CFH 77786]MBW5447907.1 PilZ domain-containing protein [Cohnella sp. CFH 77786]